ncbi:MAG: PH domain-containing protein [Patescibacteria group bacterium]|jgi:hypothetical protein
MAKTDEDKLFPSQEKEEKVFLLIRKHWFNYVPFAGIGLFMIVPAIFAIYYFIAYGQSLDGLLRLSLMLLLSIYLLFTIGLQLYGFISYYLDVYIVTDRRIVDIDQAGFFHRQISELHLHQVQDVNARINGIFPTLLHFGDVMIQTAGERENFQFLSIPNPYLVAKRIINLHEHHIENLPDQKPGTHKKYEHLEREAKTLIKKKNLSERMKSPVFESEESKKIFGDLNRGEEKKRNGELEEGKEIKL